MRLCALATLSILQILEKLSIRLALLNKISLEIVLDLELKLQLKLY